jgi:hypothetical protein
MIMKIPVLGSAFGVVMAAFIGAMQARDHGRYSLPPLKPWFDGLRSGKEPSLFGCGWFCSVGPGLGIKERPLPCPRRQ